MALQYLSPIHKASRQIGLYLEPRMKQLELSSSEAHLLTYLAAYGPCPIGELHRVFGLRRSTLTGILDRLEAKAFLRRADHPEDRRSLMLALTAPGRRQAKHVKRELQELERRITERLTATDREAFARVMTTIGEVTAQKIR